MESYDERSDPVGACVGVKGSRIHGIVKELKNENIDIINWTSNIQLLIQRALSPAKISSIKPGSDPSRISVFLKPNEISLAIGKGGCNIKLADMLTGKEIDIFRELDASEMAAQEVEEDVLLTEFEDEIDPWVIEALKGIGCDTAKSVLALPVDEIVKRADLEEETVQDVQEILRKEFEE